MQIALTVLIKIFLKVDHINWIEQFKRIRAAIDIEWPGYMIHESGAWSSVHNKWFFLPRRCSKESYNESLDEHRGCSVLISANADINDVKVVKVRLRFCTIVSYVSPRDS